MGRPIAVAFCWDTTTLDGGVHGRSARTHTIRWPIMYTQCRRALAEKGVRAVVARYADIFHLNEQHRAQLWEYIQPWQLLRQCCGTQMSGAWRVVLQSHRRHNRTQFARCVDAAFRRLISCGETLYSYLSPSERGIRFPLAASTCVLSASHWLVRSVETHKARPASASST